jgi:hypothetical protein
MHTSSTIYYLEGSGQVEFTNKVFGTLLTKLVNESWNDWDKNMSTILISYKTTFKVGTNHTPFQFVYGLQSLLPMKYPLPSKPGQNYYPTHARSLTNRLLELEKL